MRAGWFSDMMFEWRFWKIEFPLSREYFSLVDRGYHISPLEEFMYEIKIQK